MKCNNCGNEINEGAEFCPNCGTKFSNPSAAQYSQPQYNQPQYSQPQYSQPQYGQQPTPAYGYQNPTQDPNMDYTPISMWGYFGYEILFSLPCIGIILLLVFSFGGTKNINLRNFARSYFCYIIVIAVIVLIFGGLIGGMAANMLN